MLRQLLVLTLVLCGVLGAASGFAKDDGRVCLNPRPDFAPVQLTPSADRVTLLTQGFEGIFPPLGWTVMTSGESTPWVQTGAVANTGLFSAAVFYGDQGQWQDEWLVTPALDTQGLSSLWLRFAEAQEYWRNYGVYHDIMVSTTVPDDPNAFASVLTMTPDDHEIGDAWQEVIVDLSDYVNQNTVYVALRYRGDWADNWFVDDVVLDQPYDLDVAATAIVPADARVFPATEITPQVTVKNVGGLTVTFAVDFVLSHDGAIIATETQTVTDLGSTESATVAFAPFVSELGDYVLTATAQLVGDENPENDVIVGTVECLDGQRTPFGILYTNWGCGPCVSANVALDGWYPLQGNNASLIRVHVSWPSGNDPMYLANVVENDFLLNMAPTDVNGVPTLYMDNTHDMWDFQWDTWEQGVEDGFMMSAMTPSPIAIPYLGYNQDSGVVELAVEVLEALDPADSPRLFVAITEDDIAALGPNGEPVHHQVFRKLFPGVDGLPVPTEVGLEAYTVPVVLDDDWVFENLRVTVWAMETPHGAVLNSATKFLSEGVVANEDLDQDETPVPQLVTQLRGASPNPFNPQTTIRYSLARSQDVRLSIFDPQGRHVVDLVNGVQAAGDYPVTWNGRDNTGREMPSGVYLAHLVSEDGIQASKLMLVR